MSSETYTNMEALFKKKNTNYDYKIRYESQYWFGIREKITGCDAYLMTSIDSITQRIVI